MRVQPADRTKQLIFSYSKGKFLFYGVQARSQVFYGEVRSNEETDQMRPEEYVSRGGGGELWLSETELCSKFGIVLN